MTSISNNTVFCTCGHQYSIHNYSIHGHNNICDQGCNCKKYTPDPKQKAILSVTISGITMNNLKNLVLLRHGLTKGALSFEVERALKEYMSEKDLNVFVSDKQ